MDESAWSDDWGHTCHSDIARNLIESRLDGERRKNRIRHLLNIEKDGTLMK